MHGSKTASRLLIFLARFLSPSQAIVEHHTLLQIGIRSRHSANIPSTLGDFLKTHTYLAQRHVVYIALDFALLEKIYAATTNNQNLTTHLIWPKPVAEALHHHHSQCISNTKSKPDLASGEPRTSSRPK